MKAAWLTAVGHFNPLSCISADYDPEAWTMLTASFINDNGTRDALFSGVYAHANGSLDCFPVLYDSDNGGVQNEGDGRYVESRFTTTYVDDSMCISTVLL